MGSIIKEVEPAVHHRQTSVCAERCSTSRHRHSEVRPWLGMSSSWRLALARRSQASSVQARSDSSSVSTTQSSPVPGGLLYVRRWRHQSSASTFRQSSSARGAASPSQHVRPSGLRSGWSDVLELITEQSPRVGVWWQHFGRLFQTFTENISV